MSIQLETAFFPSSDKKNEIGYNVWSDDGKAPKAIIQISHGMAEHVDRYDDFARFLVENGYAVFANNHLGHGTSAKTKEDLGHIEGDEGYKNIAEDLRKMSGIARARFPDIPLILFGHSMGSFLARYYANRWSAEIDGLVICGTSGPNPLGGVGITMVNMLSRVKGERHRSSFIDNMAFGSYNSRYDNPKTAYDWLSANEENVQTYIDDELSGVKFTLSGFKNLFGVLQEVSKKDWASGIRKDLPILVISGADDPVGGFKKGVAEVVNRLRSTGIKDVQLILYDGMRHEILNETGREKVYGDVLKWAEAVVSQNVYK